MHKEFLKLLEKATGRSENVIAVNLDIRAFTPFCATVDSLRVAMYITRVYLKIITDYFNNASFYKPTGDGLIVVIPYKTENLREVANLTIESCLKLLQDFSSLCKDDPMINYPTPQKIGIGVARGSACCITSEDQSKVLDYSGRLLNLASRLMELARPSGIVFDDSFQINILKDETKKLFEEKTGYIRGVAEENPIRIYYTKKHTLLPKSFNQPIKEPKWNTDTRKYTLEKLLAYKIDWLWISLSKKLLDKNKIIAKLVYPNPLVKRIEVWYEFSIDDEQIDFRREGNTSKVGFDVSAIIELLEKGEVPKDLSFRIEVIYPVK